MQQSTNYLVAEQVPEIWFSDTLNQSKNGLKENWTRFFFIFLGHIWWFFKVPQQCLWCTPVWKIIKYGKKWRNLPSTHFSMVLLQVPETRVLGTDSSTKPNSLLFFLFSQLCRWLLSRVFLRNSISTDGFVQWSEKVDTNETFGGKYSLLYLVRYISCVETGVGSVEHWANSSAS